MRRLLLSLSLIGLLLPACGDSLDPASRVVNLRLLAVEADKPTATAGETVLLRALYENPEQKPLRWGYALCDGAASSEALDCLRALDLDTLVVSDDQPEFSFRMPALPSETLRAVSVGVAVIVCPGEIVAGDTYGVPLACQVDGQPLGINDFEMGVKRVFYAGNSENQNPTISALTFDGQPWPADEVKTITACPKDSDEVKDCKPSFRHKLAVAAEGAAEPTLDNDGKLTDEQVVAQFYATGGTFEYDVRTLESAETRFVAQKRDAGKTLTVHIVVRDNRGGVTWQTRSIEVLP